MAEHEYMNIPTPLPPSIKQFTDLDEFQETNLETDYIQHCFHCFCFSTRIDITIYLAVYQAKIFYFC